MRTDNPRHATPAGGFVIDTDTLIVHAERHETVQVRTGGLTIDVRHLRVEDDCPTRYVHVAVHVADPYPVDRIGEPKMLVTVDDANVYDAVTAADLEADTRYLHLAHAVAAVPAEQLRQHVTRILLAFQAGDGLDPIAELVRQIDAQRDPFTDERATQEATE